VALGNSGDAAAADALLAVPQDDPLVAEHVTWAVQKLRS
jgi:hypothetical protein